MPINVNNECNNLTKQENPIPESISHNYVSQERHNTTQLPTIPIPIEYDVLTSNQCYEKQNYTVKSHGAHVMSGPYEPLQYDVINKQTNESLKQQCEKALHDLNQLRRQHTETSRRCEHVMKVGKNNIYSTFSFYKNFRTYKHTPSSHSEHLGVSDSEQ